MQPPSRSARTIAIRRIGFALSVALLAGALVMIWRQRSVVIDALAAVASPAPLPLALLLGGVAANIMLAGVMFSLLMSRYGRVGRVEMQALIAATTLVNYLPLRPGLVGRVAWHKSVNNIAISDSARTLIQAAMLTALTAGYLAIVALVSIRAGINLWLGVIGPLPLLALAGLAQPLRIWCWAALVRYTEVMVWAVRYHAAFALLELPIGWQAALALACVSTIANMVPLVSNGLGLREWAIGLVSPLLTSYQLTLGLTAELINRAAELVVVTALGTVAMVYLNRLRPGSRPGTRLGSRLGSSPGNGPPKA